MAPAVQVVHDLRCAHNLTQTMSPNINTPWMQGTRLAATPPTSMTWIEKYNALIAGIRKDILLDVIGCSKELSELFDGYHHSLPAFSHAVVALDKLVGSPDEPIEAECFARIVTRHYESEDTDLSSEDLDELEYLIAAGQRNMQRAFKTLDRLRERDLEDAFFETKQGQQFGSSQWAFIWGLMAMDALVDGEVEFTPEDWYFCQLLIKVGPRDSFAFVRGFELDQEDDAQDELEFPLEASTMTAELAELERVEFIEGERLLRDVEANGSTAS